LSFAFEETPDVGGGGGGGGGGGAISVCAGTAFILVAQDDSAKIRITVTDNTAIILILDDVRGNFFVFIAVYIWFIILSAV
jgi:hypothetical protein